MRTTWTRVVAVLVAAFLLAVPASVLGACPASACSCRPPDPARTAREADFIARVRVEAVAGPDQHGDLTMRLAVVELFKGGEETEVTFLTPQATTACGLGRWRDGTVAMIVGFVTRGTADEGKADYAGGWCSLISYEEATKHLGAPHAPTGEPSTLVPPIDPRIRILQAAAIGAAVVGAGVLITTIVILGVQHRRRQ